MDRAFSWLERVEPSRARGAFQPAFAPILESVHDDPRWDAFLTRIGQHPEQLAAIEYEPRLPERN